MLGLLDLLARKAHFSRIIARADVLGEDVFLVLVEFFTELGQQVRRQGRCFCNDKYACVNTYQFLAAQNTATRK